MLTELENRLAALAAAATPLTLPATDLPVDMILRDVPAAAGGAFAPLLAEALCASTPDDPSWDAVAEPFLAGLANQGSVLHLSDVVDVLLAHPTVLQPHARRLLDVLLGDLAKTITQHPLVAAVRLTTAVRLVLGQLVSPFPVWAAIDDLSLHEAPEDFVEFLPRTLGAALDVVAAEPSVAEMLRGLLRNLTQLDVTALDAQFELGCDTLRRALDATDLAEVTDSLVQARRHFQIASAEEARLDAQALSGACAAVLAFTRDDLDAVRDIAGDLAAVCAQRTAWLSGTHQPEWTRPRRSAEIAWQELVLILERAAGHLAPPAAWMDPWEALNHVLAAYSATRTIQPLGRPSSTSEASADTGIAVLVKPVIEGAFLREQHLLALLARALDDSQTGASTDFDQATAQVLHARVRALRAREPGGARRGGAAAGSPDGPDDGDGDEGDPDLARYAPTFLRTMGSGRARELVTGIQTPRVLAALEEVARRGEVTYDSTDPVVTPLLDRIVEELQAHPQFIGEVAKTFLMLIRQTLLFLKSRLDLTQTHLLGPRRGGDIPVDYRLSPPEGTPLPLEEALQRDFHQWLLGGPLYNCVAVDEANVATGDADVVTWFGALRYRTEVKREFSNASREHLQSRYLPQAAEYSNTNVPFGQLLVLDLTPKKKAGGTWRLDEVVWLATHRPDGALVDRLVLVGVLPANRLTPSGYSRPTPS